MISKRAEAARITRQILVSERNAMRAITGKLRQIGVDVRKLYLSGNINADLSFPDGVVDAFSLMTQLQFLQGQQYVQQKIPGKVSTLRLATNRQTLDSVARFLNLDSEQLSSIKSDFDTSAIETFSRLNDEPNGELIPFINDLVFKDVIAADAIKLLDDKLSRMGFTPDNSYTVENLFKTQSQIAFNAGKFAAEQDPDIQEILWGYTYVTVGDSRVRDSHAALDGTTLPKDNLFWQTFYPPNGWSCRCAVIPVFSRQDEIQPKDLTVVPDKGFEFNPRQLQEIGLAV